MLVGGKVEGQTRMLTTAIVLETRQGNLALESGIYDSFDVRKDLSDPLGAGQLDGSAERPWPG